jgi:hypothetical protein
MKGRHNMTRNLKACGLALVAILAFSGIIASAARAETPAWLTAESFPVHLDGEQLVANVFEREGRKVTCEVATLTGTIQSQIDATTATLTPTYGNCHAIILGVKFPATVTMNGCKYVFHLTADFINNAHTFTALSDLECTSPNEVEVHIYENAAKHTAGTSMCTIKIPPQNGLKTIDLTNKSAGGTTPKDYIEAHINVAGITSSVSPTNATCGLNAHNATGTLKGSGTLKGTTDPGGQPNGITVSTEVG